MYSLFHGFVHSLIIRSRLMYKHQIDVIDIKIAQRIIYTLCSPVIVTWHYLAGNKYIFTLYYAFIYGTASSSGTFLTQPLKISTAAT